MDVALTIRKGIPRFVKSRSKKVVPCGTFSQGNFKSEVVASGMTGVIKFKEIRKL